MPHPMVKALRDYYYERGIAADDFSCPHVSECSEVAGDDFTTADEAGVGTEYLAHTLPRLCLVSIDPGELEEGTPVTVWEDPTDVEGLNAGQHWYQTHDLVSTLLSVTGSDVAPSEANLYFAHLRAVRCCENRPGNEAARWPLVRNCQSYLRRELEIVEPDIVVTQGRKAEWSVGASFEEEEVERLEEEGHSYRRLPLGREDRAHWFHTHHPRYGGYWTQKEECWPVFQKVVRQRW